MPKTPVRQYDPLYDEDRRSLATAILAVLKKADFIEEYHEGAGSDPTRERCFYRPIDINDINSIRVVVYTSIVGDQVREVGKDAVRVAAVYHSKRLDKDRGIVSETRIHRTGNIDAICGRLLTRMRKVWKAGARPTRCPQCNAPTFKSKKKNDTCADLCWKPIDQISTNSGRRYRQYRRQY